MNNPDDKFAQDFISLLDSCGFKQHINFPTHRSGNTLDLIFSRENELQFGNFDWDADISPDHYSVKSHILLEFSNNERIYSKSRKWKSFDHQTFDSDLKDVSTLDSHLFSHIRIYVMLDNAIL